MHDFRVYQDQLLNLRTSYDAVIQLEQQQDTQLLRDYTSQLETIYRTYEKLPATTPRPDTIPAIFNRTYDENFFSDYLAYVLNPDRNGLGTGPLRALLGLVSAEFDDIEIQEVEVYREFSLDSGRIDLLILIDESLVVGIENKIFSSEGVNQTGYYAEVISKEFPDHNHALVFLSPRGTKPVSKYFKAVSYKKLLDTFQALSYDWTADIKKSVLWDDFLQHLEEYIVSEKKSFELSERAQLYIENYGMLNDLERALADDWGKLLDFIQAKLNTHIQNGDWGINFNKGYTYHQAYKTSWSQTDLSIHYEFFFDRSRLAKEVLDFMFDIEGKGARKYLALFDKKYPELIEAYRKRNIDYRPNHRKISIAWKTYVYDSPFIDWDQAFIDAFDDFAFLTPHIEEVLAEYRASLETSQ